jgi:hypothetical protein
VFPVRYEHHLHIRNKAIPVIGREGLQVCEMLRIPHCLDSRLTAVKLSASPTNRALIPTNLFFFFLWYSFLLEADYTAGPSAADYTAGPSAIRRIRSVDETHLQHRVSNPRPPRL